MKEELSGLEGEQGRAHVAGEMHGTDQTGRSEMLACVCLLAHVYMHAWAGVSYKGEVTTQLTLHIDSSSN